MRKLLAILCLFPLTSFATGGDSFDEPAPPLGDTLDFLPGKSLGEIFLETTPELQAHGKGPEFDKELTALADRLRNAAPETLIKSVDDLLNQARLHYDPAQPWCNLLEDVRDVLVASAADRLAAADYIAWRVAHRDWFGFSEKKGANHADDTSSPPPDAATAEIAERTKRASGPLKAHWVYLNGGVKYASGDRDECRPWFERVAKEFPKHPRAEAAQFLLARCSFYDSRRGIDPYATPDPKGDRERAKLRADAEVLFERFRKQYLRGRFDADALGWLGALAFDGENYLKALDLYIAQAEMPAHPETLKSAVFMCEECLVRLAAKPEAAAAYALIARHPRIAMGFTYLVLSAPEADNYDGKFDEPVAVKKWRRTVLPRIASAVAAQAGSYKSGDWQPRYLAMLAQVASATGKHDEALRLTNLSPSELERSDDLLLARAIAFERANKLTDAIETYRKLLAKFPNSPIAPGARLRLAFQLQDNHQAGDALLELVQLLPGNAQPNASATPSDSEPDDGLGGDSDYLRRMRYNTWGNTYPASLETWDMRSSAVYPNLSGAALEQIEEAIDTLLNFAPCSELASALDRLGSTARNEVRAVLAERYLTQENFADAQKFLDRAEMKPLVASLDKLTAAASSATGDKADEMLRVANAWAEARGKLLRYPLDTTVAATYETVATSPPWFVTGNGPFAAEDARQSPVKALQLNATITSIKRRANARSIGLNNPDAELSERDELRQAARWWMNAARARPGSPLAAEARWKALEAIPKIARASAYTEQLAREIDSDKISREIYERLRSESPNSKEATRLAAYWSFPPPPKPEDVTSVQFGAEFDERDAHIAGYQVSDRGALAKAEATDAQNGSAWHRIERVIAGLRADSRQLGVAQMGANITGVAHAIHGSVHDIGDDYWVNFADDLVQFFAEPNITPEMQQIYVNIRLDVLHRTNLSSHEAPPISTKEDNDAAVETEIRDALKQPAMKAVADYLDVCRIALKAAARAEIKTDVPDAKEEDGKAVYTSRDYAGIERMAREFLQKFPRSNKREATVFVLARAVQAQSRPYIMNVGLPMPGSDGKDGLVDVVAKPFEHEAFDPKRVFAALDDYDREFPNGRYAADVRNLRAYALWRTHDWAKALDLTLAQFFDSAKPELQPEAALRIANIFAALEDAESRAEVLDALRARPVTWPLLKKYLDTAGGDRMHPLRYLGSYLNDQLKLNAIALN